ncbi:unnamed protein product [Cyclocybe aegerita]|uniref:Peptidase M20 dimerisation domain-containing protein n=1 Tax=Cyclocybe aegerita TaxID=1973307 RepID=A0A8S0WI40_CYCAE|nr:unnamed protein product [Cyclocybe aegerita]
MNHARSNHRAALGGGNYPYHATFAPLSFSTTSAAANQMSADEKFNSIKPEIPARRLTVVFWVVMSLYACARLVNNFDWFSSKKFEPQCPQSAVLTPKKNWEVWEVLNTQISTLDFQESAVNWLAGAVRVPTESFDDMGDVGVDPRWDAFKPFHEYLFSAFPLVHATLNLTKINTYGLHYEWKGSDASLKPLLLAAHQDVVPVEPSTVKQWKYPPYSGFFDGKRIWGRGSSDDKNGLIGILSAIETLLAAQFRPTRTVVLAFGFDEEASGLQGAGTLAPHLENVYGENGIGMIVDEGSEFEEQFGTVIATPGIAEKGYLDVLVEVTSPGGHSSIPPAHTSIGVLSALLVHFEQQPPKVEISRHEPMFDTLQCLAEHGKSVPPKLRDTIKNSIASSKALDALQAFIRSDASLSSLVSTTQAIDMINGGVKSNALPERAWALVNHRISVLSSVAELKARDADLLVPLAEKFNLTYTAFGKLISEEGATGKGALNLSTTYAGLEPAPITPTGNDAGPYQLLSGTIKSTFNAHRSLDNPDAIIVAPSMMSGNTDTCSYWRLSKHIFRYNHHNTDSAGPDELMSNIHTVNEFADVDAFMEMILFFVTLILNADESASL